MRPRSWRVTSAWIRARSVPARSARWNCGLPRAPARPQTSTPSLRSVIAHRRSTLPCVTVSCCDLVSCMSSSRAPGASSANPELCAASNGPYVPLVPSLSAVAPSKPLVLSSYTTLLQQLLNRLHFVEHGAAATKRLPNFVDLKPGTQVCSARARFIGMSGLSLYTSAAAHLKEACVNG